MGVTNKAFKAGSKKVKQAVNIDYNLQSKSGFMRLVEKRNVNYNKASEKTRAKMEKNGYKRIETLADKEKHMKNTSVKDPFKSPTFQNPLNQKIYDKNLEDYSLKNINAKFTDEVNRNAHLNDKLGIDVTGKTDMQIQHALNKSLYNRSMNPTIVDRFQESKAPKAIVAGGATAFLVSRMSDSKGQMSTSQLYGQSGGY